MEVIFCFIIAYTIGFLVGRFLYPKYDGELNIIDDSIQKPKWRLSIDLPFEEISKKKFLCLKIKSLQK